MQVNAVAVAALERIGPRAEVGRRRLFFYPGSSLGNFAPPAASAFLARLRAAMDDEGGLLLGVDLVKPAEVLQAAYDDPIGLTAAFNRNALVAANRVLGADFDPRAWDHVALWNAPDARVEMHLRALRDHEVHVRKADMLVAFTEGETIWTESSHKYTCPEIAKLGERAGFTCERQWIDEQWPFADTLFVAT